MRTTRDLRGQTRFAYAGLARDQRHSPLARRRVLPRDPKSVLFRRAANELHLAFTTQRARQREIGIDRQIPRDLQHADRVRQTLQRQCAKRKETVTAPRTGQQADNIAHQDLPRLSRAAEPARLDNRRTETVTVLPRHITSTHSDPNVNRHRTSTRKPINCLLNRNSSAHRLSRGTEHEHEAIAEGLDLGTAMLRSCDAYEPVVLASNPVGGVVTKLLTKRRRPDKVGEHHRNSAGVGASGVDHHMSSYAGPWRAAQRSQAILATPRPIPSRRWPPRHRCARARQPLPAPRPSRIGHHRHPSPPTSIRSSLCLGGSIRRRPTLVRGAEKPHSALCLPRHP